MNKQLTDLISQTMILRSMTGIASPWQPFQAHGTSIASCRIDKTVTFGFTKTNILVRCKATDHLMTAWLPGKTDGLMPL